MSLVQPSPNELESYVLKGVWKRYDEPQWSSLKWTLGNFSALFVIAALTSLIAWAQTQSWSLARYIIAQYKQPAARIPGDPTPDPLLELSQGKAIGIFLPVLSGSLSRIFYFRRRDGRNHEHRLEPVESPLFGFASIIILLLFLFLGVAIPWWITEGALGTPVVKSKITGGCINSTKIDHLLDILNRETRADEIFALCRDELNAGCDSPYWLADPQITKTRPTTCPFEGNLCLNNTQAFQITHWNISAFEMGVNSRSKVVMNHRLTCAPISLDSFLWRYANASIVYVQKLDDPSFPIYHNVSLMLSTENGPNKFSNESSGARMFKEKGPWDLTVLPRYDAGTNYYGNPEPLQLNEHLQHNDSQSFLVIHRAGPASYSSEVNDPFFSAHNAENVFKDSTVSYIADFEATALGCSEQLQYCFPLPSSPMHCTDWGARSQQHSQMTTYLATHYPLADHYDGDIWSLLEHSNDQYILSLNEMLNTFKIFQSRFGVYDYISSRIDYHNMVPLTRRKSIAENSRWIENDPEQWITEVETWFMKAYLSGILGIQDGALYALLDPSSGFSSAYVREWKLCGRILFHNGAFTNINWIGIWVTVACLIFVILVGSQVQRIHDVVKRCGELIPRLTKGGTSFLSILPRYFRQVRRPVTGAGRVWNATLLFHSLSRARPWHGGSSGPNATSNNTEMEDLEVPPAVQRGDDPTMEEYVDVDNPI